MANVGRNQPCPCGSGRRYKECHGALRAADERAPAAESAPDSGAWIPAMMQTALRAQRSGRGSEAAECYRRVLAADPSNFDANHMLALIEYEYGRYDASIQLLRRAIELRPDLGMARHNLRLLESMPQIEDGVCREIVPRLVTRIEPVHEVARFAPSAASVHVVLVDDGANEERSLLERLRVALGQRATEWWTHGNAPAGWHARTIAVAAGAYPRGGLLVLFGRSPSQATWIGASHPERVLLAVARDEPCALVDRIDEASLLDPKPGVVCASSVLAQRLGLPESAVISMPAAEQPS
jgi:hypothetical protein